MKNVKIGKIWDNLHSSYWFLPTIMAAIAIALAFTMLNLDRAGFYGPLEKWGWIYAGGANGAREVLSSVAGSVISVAATAFSITIVALQLAASNYSPRVLRNFMQDRGNQVVLGTFIATFVYSLLVLRTVRGDGDDYDSFVPQLSVTVGLLLGLASIGVLIYFIHHAATIIQVSHIIMDASNDLHGAIDRLFPEKLGRSLPKPHEHAIPANFDWDAYPVKANNSGYVQAIDNEELMQIACDRQLLLQIKSRPGRFVVKGSDLVMVFPGDKVNRKLSDRINDAFMFGRQRTEQQDVEFPVNQLVDIALRAISPGINDPTTAIECIDQLSAGLSHLAQREIPSAYRYDDDNNLRVIAEPFTFAGLTDAAFNQIRQYGKSDVGVVIRLLEAIATIARYTQNEKDRAALRRHAEMIRHDSHQAVSQELDKQDIEQRYQAVLEVL
ncbi:MAG: hypothetical protein CLLPBCKN_000338 [Chroococcidiopsis cubana SAG 39.79]|uniref:DUF2254 domain-containing protein n=1 Tax=Chroococcidiopsis cubana SAG 39.79 TaxID=388085 RepID=A0AB37UGF5_9CYAN|nr:DUF2254 domain-containing protein [Chroococcidiopsis cubana]MDZ4870950.1 hypothetical protein [Chroococcidiopsis cubana SAG 39.79]PSB51120.1 DUF2254 domain-containing protein [Chroococcidiopsis cubana CCALA 043]RUT10386.1 hypothetical protein DSM107010_42740 [Chroococcidiopsis cubana SAG 39.79]